jgi:hypothetical protein
MGLVYLSEWITANHLRSRMMKLLLLGKRQTKHPEEGNQELEDLLGQFVNAFYFPKRQ